LTKPRPMFNILILRKAFKEIDRLPADDKQRILSAIREMAIDRFVRDLKPIKNVKGLFRRRVAKNSTRTGNDSEVRAFYKPKCPERSCL